MQEDARWCFVFEEDAIVTAHIFQKFLQLAHEADMVNDPNLAFVKLFVPDRWNGWDSHDTLPLVSFCAAAGLCAGSAAALCMARCVAQRSTSASGGRVREHIVRGGLVGAAVFGMMLGGAELTGKQTLTTVAAEARSAVTGRHYVLQPLGRHHAAGTAGMAYSRSGVAHAVQYLQGADFTCMPAIDTALGVRMLEERPDLHALEVRPSLVQHIGTYSSGFRNHGDVTKLTSDSRFRPR